MMSNVAYSSVDHRINLAEEANLALLDRHSQSSRRTSFEGGNIACSAKAVAEGMLAENGSLVSAYAHFWPPILRISSVN
jgi:hypothetical protein